MAGLYLAINGNTKMTHVTHDEAVTACGKEVEEEEGNWWIVAGGHITCKACLKTLKGY